MLIRVGTRKSKLALIQTDIAISLLKAAAPEHEYQIVPITTTGDKILHKNLYDIGGKALFLKEIEEHLLSNKIDIAIHSLKDVPGILDLGLEIFAYIEREDPRDCLVSFNYKSIEDLPKGAVMGTSSVRRRAIIQKINPDVTIVGFRGNIHTRLEKLKRGDVDATILACAGLQRAGVFSEDCCFPIEPGQMLPAVGQGVICIEGRLGDSTIKDICQKVNHESTEITARAERGILSYLNASCRTPVAALAKIEGSSVVSDYMLADISGTDIRFCQLKAPLHQAEYLGEEAGRLLLKKE